MKPLQVPYSKGYRLVFFAFILVHSSLSSTFVSSALENATTVALLPSPGNDTLPSTAVNQTSLLVPQNTLIHVKPSQQLPPFPSTPYQIPYQPVPYQIPSYQVTNYQSPPNQLSPYPVFPSRIPIYQTNSYPRYPFQNYQGYYNNPYGMPYTNFPYRNYPQQNYPYQTSYPYQVSGYQGNN